MPRPIPRKLTCGVSAASRISDAWRMLALLSGLNAFVVDAIADMHVSTVALASRAYTERKFGGSQVQAESYVFMEGHFFPGIRVDRSIDRMTFRHIAESLAPELARSQFFPAKDPHAADLLVVVHWGTTKPYGTEQQMSVRTEPVTDMTGTSNGANGASQRSFVSPSVNDVQAIMQHDAATPWAGSGADAPQISTFGVSQAAEEVEREMTQGSNAKLLGYDADLRRLSTSSFSSPEEDSLHFDLSTERYFIILKAYDLREKISSGHRRRAVWTVHLNMRSLGINFETALASMGRTAAEFAGRSTDRIQITLPGVREGKVETGPPIILGVVK